MIRQCRCGFATDDQLWFESHQAQHILKRDHDVAGLTVGQLERARRDLLVSLSLAFPGSPVRVPILARISAIDAELAARVGGPHEQLPGFPFALSPWRGPARRVEKTPRRGRRGVTIPQTSLPGLRRQPAQPPAIRPTRHPHFRVGTRPYIARSG